MQIFYNNFQYDIILNDVKQNLKITIDGKELIFKINNREYVSYVHLTNYYFVKKCINANVMMDENVITIIPCKNMRR